MNASDLLEERYRLERLLGTGGMSEVWLAEDKRLGRWVAVKLLGGLGAEARAIASREARMVARLQHPNIVTVFDVGSHRGEPFFVMEYVHGYSIRQLLETQGRFTESEVIRYGAQIAAALESAHRQGVVHRDVKPENILIDEHGMAKLADFGVASAVTQTLAPGQAEGILGTIAYLPPEVIQGANPDAAGDVYSLALTLYEMVAGRLPFVGTSLAAMAGQRLGTPIPPLRSFARSATPELEATLARALHLNPSERFGSAREFAAALRSIPAGRPGTVPPTIAPPGRTPRPLSPQPGGQRRHPTAPIRQPASSTRTVGKTADRSNWTVAIVLTVVLLALGAGVGVAMVLVSSRDGGEPPTPTATATRSATSQPTARPTNEPTLTPTVPRSPSASPSATQTPPKPTVTPTSALSSTPVTGTPTPPKPSPSPLPTSTPTPRQ